MNPITSDKNSLYRQFLSLQESAGIKKFGQFIVSGSKVVPEALDQSHVKPLNLLITSEMRSYQELESAPRPIELSPTLFKTLDLFNTRFPLLVCELPSLPTANLHSEPHGLELLLPLGDPSNLGAVLRAAEAFNVQKVILLKEAAQAFHPKVLRASSGSVFRVNLQLGPSIHDLSEVPYIWTLDNGGKNIRHFKWPKNLRLLVGEEGPGIPKSLGSLPTLSIPINDSMDSLNAAVATGVALYDYQSKVTNSP